MQRLAKVINTATCGKQRVCLTVARHGVGSNDWEQPDPSTHVSSVSLELQLIFQFA